MMSGPLDIHGDGCPRAQIRPVLSSLQTLGFAAAKIDKK